MHSDVLIVARPDRRPRIECHGRDRRAPHRARHRAPGVVGRHAAGRRHDPRSGWSSNPGPGCGCAPSRRPWRCPEPPTQESHATWTSRWPASSTSTRSRPSSPPTRGTSPRRGWTGHRTRARSGCANGFRSAEPVSGKASGRVRCTPTSTARRCCGTASSWAPDRWPTTSSARPAACISELHYPDSDVDADRNGAGAGGGRLLTTWQGDRL